MARKTQAREPSSSPEPSDSESLSDPPSIIDPYKTLLIDKSATQDQVKSAYRKAALKHHPDKVTPEDKDEAHKRFQEVAFAYAILSDEKRRRRYDTTGSTAESLNADDDDFNWADFFREQKAAIVDGEAIDKVKNEYQGSEQEKEDLLKAYVASEGDMDAVYEEVMCSSVLDDDRRFRHIIDLAIKDGRVEGYTKYVDESKASKRNRVKAAKGEEAEAMELAEELGVKEKLFGKKSKKGAAKAENGEADLQALIQQRQKGRAEGFLDQLEAKYGGSKRGKRKVEEPPEELFQKNAKKSKERTK